MKIYSIAIHVEGEKKRKQEEGERKGEMGEMRGRERKKRKDIRQSRTQQAWFFGYQFHLSSSPSAYTQLSKCFEYILCCEGKRSFLLSCLFIFEIGSAVAPASLGWLRR